MPLRLLHTADWQIGRVPSAFEPDDAAALAEERFRAVERIAALAVQHGADAVLVAGDVFDAQTVSDKTLRRLFHATAGYAGPWLLLPGNHDAALAESVWTRAQRLGVVPPHVVPCLAPQASVIDGRHGARFALLPAPLAQRHTQADASAWFDAAPTPEGLPRIGLAHGAVQGRLPGDADAANPIAADRAATARLDWLALGDWHGTLVVDERTAYAGTPETDRFRANDSGQALLVAIEAAGAPPQVQRLATGRYRWRTLEQRFAVASDVDAALETLAACGADDVLQLRSAGRCDLAGHRRWRQGVAAARARVRALVEDADALRLAPTDDDLAALHADGWVGEVLAELRAAQDRPDSPAEAERARDALAILAALLADGAAPPAEAGR